MEISRKQLKGILPKLRTKKMRLEKLINHFGIPRFLRLSISCKLSWAPKTSIQKCMNSLKTLKFLKSQMLLKRLQKCRSKQRTLNQLKRAKRNHTSLSRLKKRRKKSQFQISSLQINPKKMNQRSHLNHNMRKYLSNRSNKNSFQTLRITMLIKRPKTRIFKSNK